MAFTFHVSLLTRSVTSTSSSSMSFTDTPAAFVLAAERAASSFTASKTMYGISISVTSPFAFTFCSRSVNASSTLVAISESSFQGPLKPV